MHSQLGDIVFDGAISPNALELSKAVSYSEHARIGGKPRLQRTGAALDTVKISLYFNRIFCIPEDEIAKVKAYLESGEVLTYVKGTGEVIGTFVIQSMKENPTSFILDGRLMDVTIEVELLESYQDNSETSATQTAIAAGFANSVNAPIESVEVIAPITPVAVASNNIVALQASSGGMSSAITTAQRNPARAASALRSAGEQARQALNSAGNAINALNQTVGDIYDRTRDTVTAIDNYVEAVNEFRAACAAGDLLAAADAMLSVTNTGASVTETSAVISQIASSRIPVPSNG